MTWWKADARLQCSPRLRSVANQHGGRRGKDATLAWVAVLSVNGEHGCDGDLENLYVDPEYLGTFAPLLTKKELLQALADIKTAGLVGDREGGGLVILGWDETWQAVKPSTERVRRHRKNKQGKEDRSDGQDS